MHDSHTMNLTSTHHPLWTDDIIVPVTIVTDLLTIVFNLLPIYTVLRQKRLYPYALDESILVFSVTEILVVSVTMPLGLISYYAHTWIGGKITCIFYQMVVIWAELMTICLVTTMGIERIACVKRLVAGDCSFKRHDLKKNRIRLAIVIVVSLVVSIAPAVGLAPSGYSGPANSCRSVLISRTEHNEQYIFYLCFLMIGYFNVIINAVIYSSLIAQLVTFKKGNRGPMALESTLDTTELEQMEIHSQQQEVVFSTVMVVIVALIYYTTTIPALILVTIQKVSKSAVDTRIVVYSLLVTNISGVVLPLMYPLVSRRYLLQYKRVLHFIFACRCKSTYAETIPELLSSRQPTGTPDTESQSDLSQPIESCHVTTKSNSIVVTKGGSIQNQPVRDHVTNSLPINGNATNARGSIDLDERELMNGGVMNQETGIMNEDVLEETTYITHDSENEDDEFCMAGSSMNLMSSDED